MGRAQPTPPSGLRYLGMTGADILDLSQTQESCPYWIGTATAMCMPASFGWEYKSP